MIAPYVIGPEGKRHGYTLLDDPEDFYTELDYLFEHAARRKEAAGQFLDANGQ